MNEIYATALALLPTNKKLTTGGWQAFNGFCCHHRGESRDTKKRAGFKDTGNGGFTIHCFNCNFACGWSPGKLISKNTKCMFEWLGLSEADIGKLGLVALRLKDADLAALSENKTINFLLLEKQLPAECFPITQWIAEGTTEPDLVAVIEYVLSRGMEFDWYNWHWCALPGYRDRVMIPFYHDGKIVGHTGRKIRAGKPKYLTEAQSGYVFNLDRQTPEREYTIVVEGQFDAIAIDAAAIMCNTPNDAQIARLKALGKEVIVVPDRDKAGAYMLNIAIEQNWSVSLPPWGDDIKDVAEAVKRYGRLYVLTAILHYRVDGEIKIGMLQKKLKAISE